MEINENGGDVDRRIVGRTPEGKVEIVTTLGKFFGVLLTVCTIFLLITNKIVNDSNDRLKLELQNIFITKVEAMPRTEYELRHRDLEATLSRIEKQQETNIGNISADSRRLDRLELQAQGQQKGK